MELVLVVPGLLLLMLVLALGGRLVEARGAVAGAARDAARAASLARYPGNGSLGADTLAQSAASSDLTSYCAGPHLDVVVTGFPALGQVAVVGENVTVTVQCDIDTSVFGLLGFGPRYEIRGSAVAPLDPLMCRGTTC